MTASGTPKGRMPNFLVIGAGKSGTTALYNVLKQHPAIFMSPVKEPRFFTAVGLPPGPHALLPTPVRIDITRLEDYQALFRGATTETAIGEASPIYLSSLAPEQTATAIRSYLPDIRLIALLRHPAERAYSEFNFRRQLGVEPISDFARALAAEQERIRQGWWVAFRYRANGCYATNLQPYYDLFPREQIRVYLYEEWNTQPISVLQDIFRFLHVDDAVVPEVARRFNTTYLPRSHTFNRWLRRPHRVKSMLRSLLPQRFRQRLGARASALNRTRITPLDPQLRKQLTNEYREEILRLQELIERDLSHWLA